MNFATRTRSVFNTRAIWRLFPCRGNCDVFFGSPTFQVERTLSRTQHAFCGKQMLLHYTCHWRLGDFLGIFLIHGEHITHLAAFQNYQVRFSQSAVLIAGEIDRCFKKSILICKCTAYKHQPNWFHQKEISGGSDRSEKWFQKNGSDVLMSCYLRYAPGKDHISPHSKRLITWDDHFPAFQFGGSYGCFR